MTQNKQEEADGMFNEWIRQASGQFSIRHAWMEQQKVIDSLTEANERMEKALELALNAVNKIGFDGTLHYEDMQSIAVASYYQIQSALSISENAKDKD